MGKNTMIRKAIRGHLQTNPDLEKLLPYIVGNVGFVFTNGDLSDVRAKLLENRRVRFMDTFQLFDVFGEFYSNENEAVLLAYIILNHYTDYLDEFLMICLFQGAPAKAGAIAPCDVKLPPQNTGMGPEKTSFFQALQIPTKISRGTIEILNEVHLIKTGEKVGASESALLNMLNIMPFSYGLVVRQVWNCISFFFHLF